MNKKFLNILFAILPAILMGGCETEKSRIPALPVHIVLDNAGLWNIYGVHGWGEWQSFIASERIPSNFPFTATTYTGLGGVLLIYGSDPFAGELGPLAYDLACPVERQENVRIQVQFDGADGIGVCTGCGSEYNLTTLGGAAIEGTAKQLKYNLQRYECYPNYLAGSATIAGYIIERRR